MYQIFNIIAVVITALICLLGLYRSFHPAQRPPGKAPGRAEALVAKAETVLEKHSTIFLLLLFAAFLFTRLYLLGAVPGGINQDEMGMAIDASCISRFGVDRYLHKMPVYLMNFGDGQSVLYAYMTAFLFQFLDFNLIVIRLPAVLSAIPCFFSVYGIARILFNKKTVALFACGVMTIMPVYLMSERWGLDCYLLLSFLTISVYLYMKAVETAKKRYFLLAGILFGVTFYTYVISYLMIPLFLLLSALYLFATGKIDLKRAAFLFIPVVLLGLPLLIFQLVNMKILPEFSTPFTDMYRLRSYRGGELGLHNIFVNWRIFKNLFIPDTILYYNALPEFGTVYLLSVPLFVYGLCLSVRAFWRSVRKRVYDGRAVVFLLFAATFAVVMLLHDPNVHKANGFYLPVLLLIVIAFENLLRRFKLSAPAVALLYCVAFLFFGNFYYRHYNIVYNDVICFHNTQLGDVVSYLNKYYDVAGRDVYIFEKEESLPDQKVFLYGNVSPFEVSEDKKTLGNYHLGLPEEIDLNEDCVYVIHKYLHHVSDWLGTSGFLRDDSFRDYSILYRPPQSAAK